MKRFRKALTVVMCVVMTLTAAPLNGFVGMELPDGSGFKKIVESVSAVFDSFSTKAQAATYSGTCGDNLTWTLDTSTGVLNITGTGAMNNWSSYSSVPWYSYRSKIKTVNIESGVTTIGNNAFQYCDSLTSVTIGNSVTTIGDYAFSYCDSLTSVTIPDSVTTIGESAFYVCTSLTSVTIPDSVTTIGSEAFGYCKSLTSIIIPDGITGIGNAVFNWCTSITSVTIPDSVISIGEAAFYGCSSLESIIIPDSVTSIAIDAFSENPLIMCNKNSYAHEFAAENSFAWYLLDGTEKENTISGKVGTELIWSIDKRSRKLTVDNNGTMVSFDSAAAPWKEHYKYILIAEINCGCTSISSYAFNGCTYLVSIKIPDSVTSIGASAFDGCESLASVTIPDSVTSIGEMAFRGCFSLENITIPDSVISIGASAFDGCESLASVTIGNNVTTIGDAAFYSCYNLTSVTIPDSVTTIGNSAFAWCDSLTSVTIPDSVTTIGKGVFSSCWCLKSVEIGNGITSIVDGMFAQCNSLENVTISNSVKSINGSAFYECMNLKSITIPDSVTSINGSAFYECMNLKSITIGNGVTSIASGMFSTCFSLTSVTIGNSVTSIDENAFENCSSLESITIPDSVTSIGEDAFYNCTALKDVYYTGDIAGWCSISFANSYSNLMYYADNFYIDGKLVEEIIIPDSVTNIRNYAFYGCDSLTSITIPDSVTSVGGYAFANCSSLENVTLGDNMTAIGSNAFENLSDEFKIIISTEDSKTAITLIDYNVPFTALETGMKDSDSRMLDMNNTVYYSVLSSASSSGLENLFVKYAFKESVSGLVSGLSLRIKIPFSAKLFEDSIKLDGVPVTNYQISNNILTIPLNTPSGAVSFCIQPDSAQCLMSYALMDYTLNGNTVTETVGIYNLASEVLTLKAPDETSETTVVISGVSAADTDVNIFVNDSSVGSCRTSKIGNYSKLIELEEPEDGKLYAIKAMVKKSDGTEKSVTDYLTYNVETVKMTSCKMYYAGVTYDMMNMQGKSPIVTWNGGSFSFSVTFENSKIIDELYIVSKKGSEIKKIKAHYDEQKDAFVANGFNGYIPGSITVEYNADNKEFIVDVNSAVDFQEVYEAMPDSIKNSEVEILENTFDEETSTGKISAVITHENSDADQIRYNLERKRVSSDSEVTEKSLKKDGFEKVNKSDGSYEYVKLKIDKEKDKAYIETWEFTDVGTLAFNTILDVESAFEIFNDAGEIGVLSQLLGIAVDVGDMAVDYHHISQAREEINSSQSLSKEEKERKLQELDALAAGMHGVDTLKITSSVVLLVGGIALGPAGLATSLIMVGLGFVNNIAWNIMEKNMNSMFNKYMALLAGINFRYAVDPSGFVYEAVTGNRLPGVKTTIYYKDAQNGTAVLWDASEYDQTNPLYTDINGCYAWDVPEGLWQVKCEKDGYETVYSEWLPVPPPQLDVNIAMNSLAAPEVDYVHAYDEGIEIGFSQYMTIDSVNSKNVVITSNGITVSGEFAAKDAQTNYEKTASYAKTFLFVPDEQIVDSVSVRVSNAENYCSTKMEDEFSQTIEKELKIQSLEVPDCQTAEYSEKTIVTISAYPTEAAVGKNIDMVMDNDYIASAKCTSAVFDESGKAYFEFTGLLPGQVNIEFSVEDTDISETMQLSVEINEKAHSHSYTSVVTLPTCTEDGYTTYTCSCGDTYTDSETEATGHSHESKVTKEPTCEEDGVRTFTCHCGDSYTETIKADGHTKGEWETKVEPGCVSEGTKVKKCTVCGETVETGSIPAIGHDYKAEVTKPTCTEDGYTTHTCSVCKDSYTDSVVKAEGHKYNSVVTPNTCTKDGYTTHTCSVCGDAYTDNETQARGHSHESKVTKEPTCTNTGIRTFTCHCGDSYTEVIKANGHTKGEWEYIGGKEYAKSCTVCGDKLESKIVTVDMFFNSENVNKKQVLNKSTATVTATVTDNFVNDLVFASSDSSTVSVDANGNVVANNIGKATITVTIKGTAISDSIEVEVLPRDFTVTWNVNGKQTKQTVKEEAKFTPNVNTTLKGYKFIGWDKTVPTTMPAENLTFTAQYELIVKQLKIKNPSTSTINYGETLVIHADFGGVELPEGWKIQWTVEGAGFNMTPAADGLTCNMTSVANGNATVKATLVDENGEAVLDSEGNEMSDTKELKSNASFWQKIVSFFKNLFRVNRIISE